MSINGHQVARGANSISWLGAACSLIGEWEPRGKVICTITPWSSSCLDRRFQWKGAGGRDRRLNWYWEFVPVPARHAALGILGCIKHDQAMRGAVVIPGSLQHVFGCLNVLSTEKRPGFYHHRLAGSSGTKPYIESSVGSCTSGLSNPPMNSSCGSVQRHAVFVRQPAASEEGAARSPLSCLSPKLLPENTLRKVRPWQPGRLSALPGLYISLVWLGWSKTFHLWSLEDWIKPSSVWTRGFRGFGHGIAAEVGVVV